MLCNSLSTPFAHSSSFHLFIHRAASKYARKNKEPSLNNKLKALVFPNRATTSFTWCIVLCTQIKFRKAATQLWNVIVCYLLLLFVQLQRIIVDSCNFQIEWNTFRGLLLMTKKSLFVQEPPIKAVQVLQFKCFSHSASCVYQNSAVQHKDKLWHKSLIKACC